MRKDMRVERRVRKGTKSSSLGSSTIASESSSETGTAKQHRKMHRNPSLGTETETSAMTHAGAFWDLLSGVPLHALYLSGWDNKVTLKRYSVGIEDE